MPNTALVPLLRRTFWISVAVIAAVALTVIVVAIAQRDREQWTQHSRAMARLARTAQLLALDRETGVRGFLLSGDSASLAPDLAARAPLRAALDSLVSGTADNPAQQQRARAFAAAIARWDLTFATPVVAQRVANTANVTTSFGAVGLAGKVLFDDVRTRFREFEAEEERLYSTRSRASVRLQLLDAIVALVGLTILGLILSTLRRRVTRQAVALVDRQSQLEEQAVELEEQASELEEQATELETQTEELQDTVRELARKNEELDAFSASVAHDLRSPLRSIDGFSHMLMSDYAAKLDDGGISALKRIRANAQRMGELIDGLLSLARVSGVELRSADVNLSTIATTAAEDVQRTAGVTSRTQYVVQPGLTARGDARLLRVVLTNLVDNAFKFTRLRSDARVEVGTRDVDGERAFFVTDNGVGFDMRHAGKLFGAFERLHDDKAYEGTGIGLATVKRIVERHGGRLWADSEPGRGATFYFTLPA
ncbi:MAG TPA: ATP-binding protein [Gemmatimonadaceae bacterium]|nr:ATP-binding protein [Gemmatimonadaceae bacterium]